MDHNVTHINQNPVTLTHAFDPTGAKTRTFNAFDQMLGNRPHLTRRAARCNHHIISNRGFTTKVDSDDIFGLVLIKTVQDQLKRVNAVG